MDPPSKRPKRNNTSLTSARLFNADSPVTTNESNIQTFLSTCLLNWSQYGEDEKISIMKTLPPAYQPSKIDVSGNIICPISPEFVAHDKVLRDQIARFKRDVKEGFYTKTWQEKARKAMEERSNGKFDEYLSNHAEQMFIDDDDQEGEAGGSSDGDYGTKAKGKSSHKSRNKEHRSSRGRHLPQDVIDAELDGS